MLLRAVLPGLLCSLGVLCCVCEGEGGFKVKAKDRAKIGTCDDCVIRDSAFFREYYDFDKFSPRMKTLEAF